MSSIPICPASELPPGQRKIVETNGRSIGVFNVDGKYYALKNTCPHQFAPLCEGALKGVTREGPNGEIILERDGEILRCPWHGWEFDLTSGRSVFNPHKLRVKTYKVTVEPNAEPSVTDPAAPDPTIETYPVTIENGTVTLHI